MLALAGVGVGAAIGYRFYRDYQDPRPFLAPGRCAVDIAKPGEWILWLDHRTVFEGRTWDVPARMPSGARLRVAGPDGSELRVYPSSGTSWKSGTSERASIAAFRAGAPGRYMVSVEGSFEPRVFSAGPDVVTPLFKTVGGVLAAVFAGLISASVLGLYVFVKRLNAARAPPVSAS
jgi:hypothetical protein